MYNKMLPAGAQLAPDLGITQGHGCVSKEQRAYA